MHAPSIGNDIVDLLVDEPALHPRYLSRVLSSRERLREQTSRGVWIHWAAKEAAYKAIKRILPETRFIPSQFEVDTVTERVRYLEFDLPCRIIESKTFVHVICATDVRTLSGVRYWIEDRPESDSALSPSEHVRIFAADCISSELGVPSGAISFSRSSLQGLNSSNIPQLFVKEEQAAHLVSFSHHGRYVACAFYLHQVRQVHADNPILAA